MAEIRVGDWVCDKKKPHVRGRVREVRGGGVSVDAGDAIGCLGLETVEHCAPDPLPETLPAGTECAFEDLARRIVSTSAATMRSGRYWANWSDPGVKTNVGPENIDWTSYHAAIHREQDEAARRAQGASDANGTRSVEMLHEDRTKRKPPVFVPPVGARVRIDAIHPTGVGHWDECVGRVVVIDRAELSSIANGHNWIAIWPKRGEPFPDGLLCRVSPLPASAIEVECPLTDEAAAKALAASMGRSFTAACQGSVGRECTRTNSHGGPANTHLARHRLFASLTGKDSGPDHAGTKAAASDSRAQSSESGNAAQRPAGQGGATSPGHVQGDSGTGRAAGKAGNAESLPAAPSGFKPPRTIDDVPCEACGAKSQRDTPSSSKTWCRNPDGTQLHDGNGFADYHALRIAAFEARRERAEAAPLPRCECGQEIRLPAKCSVATRTFLDDGDQCVDCAIEFREARNVAILRTDLDRPLPKAQAAERIWPPAWSSASSESDP